MTIEQLQERIEALEAEVRELKAHSANQLPKPRSWLAGIDEFADDPTFEEAARLGREYRDQMNRESLRKWIERKLH